jgi:exopolysaccharide biosynthesis protein
MEAVVSENYLKALIESLNQNFRDFRHETNARFDKQDTALNTIRQQTTKTNGIVKRNTADIEELKRGDQARQHRVRRTSFYRDPQVLKVLGYVLLVVLIIIAGLLGLRIPQL